MLTESSFVVCRISYNNLMETVIVCPLTTKALISGVNSHALVSLPIKVNAIYDIPEGKIKFEVGLKQKYSASASN